MNPSPHQSAIIRRSAGSSEAHIVEKLVTRLAETEESYDNNQNENDGSDALFSARHPPLLITTVLVTRDSDAQLVKHQVTRFGEAKQARCYGYDDHHRHKAFASSGNASPPHLFSRRLHMRWQCPVCTAPDALGFVKPKKPTAIASMTAMAAKRSVIASFRYRL